LTTTLPVLYNLRVSEPHANAICIGNGYGPSIHL